MIEKGADLNAYLDNSATTRPCKRAMERMNESMREGYFNPSSLYAQAGTAERAMSECRRQLLAPIHGQNCRVIFTSGGTEANNLALMGGVSAMHGKQHIISCVTEHPSVLAALSALEADGHRVTLLSVDQSGAIDPDQLATALQDGASLVSLMHVNNETGALLDIQHVSRLVRQIAPKALIHVDGVQGYLRAVMDMRWIDMYTLSAHKIHGPKGIGALVLGKGVRLLPRQLGGGQEDDLRSGTENTVGIAGLRGAVEHMLAQDDLPNHLMEMKRRLYHGLEEAIPNVQLNGPALDQGAPHILNISFPPLRAEVLLHALEGDGILCSTGSACSSRKRKLSPVLVAMGLNPNRAEAALRFSLSPDTTPDEIDYTIERAAAQYDILKRFRRR